MELGNMNVARRQSSVPANRSRLTAEERRRLRDANACFYCRQPGHIMSRCPSRPNNSAPSSNQDQGNGNGTNPRAR
jgi:Zinc knuckle